jgi:glycerol kinase
MAQPGGLPGSTRAEKKEALVWQGEKTTSKLHFAPHSGINASILSTTATLHSLYFSAKAIRFLR